MRVDALGLLANKTVARITDKVVPCGRGFSQLISFMIQGKVETGDSYFQCGHMLSRSSTNFVNLFL